MLIKLIVGLRNPGITYEKTRHNAGAWFLEALAKHHNIVFKIEKKLHSELGLWQYQPQACKLLLPTIFMNQSGLAVQETCQFYRILPEEVLVIHDDLDLEAGRIKLKSGGGHGGHNGLRDIISHLGKNDFHRLRIGIGHPGHKDLVLNYVLGQPNTQDKQMILQAIDRNLETIPLLIEGRIALAMNKINS